MSFQFDEVADKDDLIAVEDTARRNILCQTISLTNFIHLQIDIIVFQHMLYLCLTNGAHVTRFCVLTK